MEITRREFVKLTLMTGAAACLAGCALPPHQFLVSQLDMPEYREPGESVWFATTCQGCGGGCGVSVRVMDGRAKKIEGIPVHPVNHGKVCARGHSELQALYNPDRLPASLKANGSSFTTVKDQSEIFKLLANQLDAGASRKGRMLWITKPLSGTKGALLAYLAEKVGAKIWMLEFPGSQAERTAMKSLTGKPELPYNNLLQSDYAVSFGSDFLLMGNSPVHDGWQYGEFRQGKSRHRDQKRGILVTFSPHLNTSTANSDRWIPVAPGTEGWAAVGLGNLISSQKKGEWPAWAKQVPLETISKITGVPEGIYQRLSARLLSAHHPAAFSGSQNGVYTNGVWNVAMIQALNHLLTGEFLSFENSDFLLLPDQKQISAALFLSTKEALNQMEFGSFETIWVFDTNPRFLLPSAFNFEVLFNKAKNKVVFTPFIHETALLADYIIATQSWLEEWGDRRIEGPFGIKGERETLYELQQPVCLVPDWGRSISISDVLLASVKLSSLQKEFPWNNLNQLLKSRYPDQNSWETLIVRGGIWKDYPLNWEMYQGNKTDPLYPPRVVKETGKIYTGSNPWEYLKKISFNGKVEPEFSGSKKGFVLLPYPSLALGDGSLANRPWMQELPDPMTTIVWASWIEVPAGLAKQLNLTREDVIQLETDSGMIQGPVYPNPGLHPSCVAVPVGQGHYSYGQYAYNRGFNPLSIIHPMWNEAGELAWYSTMVQVKKTNMKQHLTLQDTRMDRLPVQILTL